MDLHIDHVQIHHNSKFFEILKKAYITIFIIFSKHKAFSTILRFTSTSLVRIIQLMPQRERKIGLWCYAVAVASWAAVQEERKYTAATSK